MKPSRDSMVSGPALPVELEREIFETTALMHRNTIPVASGSPIEPLLYTVLAMDEAEMAKAVQRAMRVKPPSFFRDHVRHLLLSPSRSLSDEELHEILRLCPRIVSLCLGHMMSKPALLPILEAMSEVRRWSGSLDGLFGTGRAVIDHPLGNPFFRTVTHMDIFDAVDNSDLDGLAAMPALTHLCLSDDLACGDNFLRHVLDQCSHLQLLANFLHYSEDKITEIAANPPVADLRFVVYVYHDYWAEWKTYARGGHDFWAAADAFVARKRRGEIEGTSSFVHFNRKKHSSTHRSSPISFIKIISVFLGPISLYGLEHGPGFGSVDKRTILDILSPSDSDAGHLHPKHVTNPHNAQHCVIQR
ncbi:hypothetical protein DFH09DRAFT_1131724 [Mycena vulgaris]|nr:hypothetical protein DFH09DRAFT_1131724 [Mycena vulgaris]